MRAFFDTEFYRVGSKKKRKFVFASIGILRDDGSELHMVSSECDPPSTEWYFKKNVWKHLANEPKHTNVEIAEAVRGFLAPVSLLVTREGGYDRLVLESLVGPLWMHFCDIERVWQGFGAPALPERGERIHHALQDAHWHRTMFNHVLAPVMTAA